MMLNVKMWVGGCVLLSAQSCQGERRDVARVDEGAGSQLSQALENAAVKQWRVTQQVRSLEKSLLFSRYDAAEQNHMLSKSSSEGSPAFQNEHFDENGQPRPVIGVVNHTATNLALLQQIEAALGPITKQLYRCRVDRPSGKDHFVSAKPNCEDKVYETSFGYATTVPLGPFSAKLYRCLHPTTGDHLVTVDQEECKTRGYAVETTDLGYVHRYLTPATVSAVNGSSQKWLYSKFSHVDTDHLLTEDLQEANDTNTEPPRPRYRSDIYVPAAGSQVTPAALVSVPKGNAANLALLADIGARYGAFWQYLRRCRETGLDTPGLACSDGSAGAGGEGGNEGDVSPAPVSYQDHFASTSSECSGHTHESTYGFVFSEPVGQFDDALYSCYRSTLHDRKVSVDPRRCELDGYRVEALLGYVHVPAATQAALDTPGFILPTFIGHGRNTVGGRGGKILHVTTLDDLVTRPNGTVGPAPGSLREALLESGPRVIVFDVAGAITLGGALTIENPNVTILGESAPAPGITLQRAGLEIYASEVIVRHLRIRVGDHDLGPMPPSARDGISIYPDRTLPFEPVNDIVVDHSSLFWAVDENIGMFCNSAAGVARVSLTNNLIAEGLKWSIHDKVPIHSMGILVGDACKDVTMFGNVLAHNNWRNPNFAPGSSGEALANVVYNSDGNRPNCYDRTSTACSQYPNRDAVLQSVVFHAPNLVTNPTAYNEPISAAIVNNAFIPGPDTSDHTHHFAINERVPAGTRIHLSGNVGPNLCRAPNGQWRAFVGHDIHPSLLDHDDQPGDYRQDTPPSHVDRSIRIREMSDVLDLAGARADGRDAHDLRVLSNVHARVIGATTNLGSHVDKCPTATPGGDPICP